MKRENSDWKAGKMKVGTREIANIWSCFFTLQMHCSCSSIVLQNLAQNISLNNKGKNFSLESLRRNIKILSSTELRF